MSLMERGGDSQDKDDAIKRWGMALLVVLLAGCAVSAVGVYVMWSNRDARPTAEMVLGPLLIAAVVVLTVTFGVLAVVFKGLKLSDRRYPMGLPEGSIRAVIALMLVLLFFITGIYLAGQIKSAGSTGLLQCLSPTVADALPVDRVVSRVQVGTGPDICYDVRLDREIPESFDRFAGQLLTTLSTLVVAVSAFYFGSSSARESKEARAVPAAPVVPDATDTSGAGDRVHRAP